MKKTTQKVLRELMANPKGSDRSVAVKAGVSQPTITRIRSRLIEEGIIQSYEIIPNLKALGFEIIAFSRVGSDANVFNDTRAVYAVQVTKMCSLKGTKNVMVMSVHPNYADYSNFLREYQAEPMFLTATSTPTIKPLSFKQIPF